MKTTNKITRLFKRTAKKRPNLSLKRKLFFYLAGFCAFVIILLWIGQIVFLDDFYYRITVHRLKSAAASLSKVESEQIQSAAEKTAVDNEINILVYLTSGKLLASVDFLSSGILHRLDSSALNRFYNSALEGGGESITHFKLDFIDRFPPQSETEWEASPYQPKNNTSLSRGIVDRLIYTKIATNPEGQSLIIMFDCAISPVAAVTRTLTVQLAVISVLLVTASLLLALLISRRISRPIVQINQSAKVLAAGNYETSFSGEGYKEISELSDTLNYAAHELSKVEKLRRELIANVSHDLRTPLTMITGYSEAMRDIPGENTPENIQVIIDDAKRLNLLVNDLLELSKHQSGSVTLSPAPFNLTDLLNETIARYKKMTEAEGYQFVFDCSINLTVFADRGKISQVIYNLINNAVNYTGEDKKVTVRLYRRENMARIEISDTGEGIPADHLPYIWDRYYKIDKIHRRASVGTGLGLSIVKNILELHRVPFGVKSIPRLGSTFWFELPYIERAPDSLPDS